MPMSEAACMAERTEVCAMPCTRMSLPIRATYLPLRSLTTKLLLHSPPISGSIRISPRQWGSCRR